MTTQENAEKTTPICFVIMPISDVHGYEPGHFARVYEHLLKPAIVAAGYSPVRADDAVKTDYIVVGIIQKIVESEMVICDFSARNPNVMYELGIRHAFNKPVTLVKDRRTEKVFDIQGLRYTEYDDSLRIDSVQKDVSKISVAITETAKVGENGLNSVIQLAGIKTAEVPAGQKVSPDTQLLLSAIGALERRIESVEIKGVSTARYFRIEGDKVIFAEGSEGEINDSIANQEWQVIGTLVDIHPLEEKIFIRQESGKIIPYSAFSVKSKGLQALPF
ncbi:hypothetical protein GALL_78020 [mine drainage metagenome]|uniref:Uncharacterized protein n=1 Tax=mine drainage metagenome TaxID=410659 RepID=A0A1J5SPQ1_9ZZZZ